MAPGIEGLSARVVREIDRLEHARNCLGPGSTADDVRVWKEYVRSPLRRLWSDEDSYDLTWYCCGDPFEARTLLDSVMQALSARGARELRRIVRPLDEVWDRR